MTTGSLRGRVTDSSGAVMSKVRLELTSDATGTTLTGLTGRSGEFLFPALKVWLYSLNSTARGFRTSRISGLVVQVGQTTTTEISMELGAASETVTVTATTPLLRSTESTLSTVVSRSLLDGLPLSGRRYTDFALLTPN